MAVPWQTVTVAVPGLEVGWADGLGLDPLKAGRPPPPHPTTSNPVRRARATLTPWRRVSKGGLSQQSELRAPVRRERLARHSEPSEGSPAVPMPPGYLTAPAERSAPTSVLRRACWQRLGRRPDRGRVRPSGPTQPVGPSRRLPPGGGSQPIRSEIPWRPRPVGTSGLLAPRRRPDVTTAEAELRPLPVTS
jgi:hypothetical protein